MPLHALPDVHGFLLALNLKLQELSRVGHAELDVHVSRNGFARHIDSLVSLHVDVAVLEALQLRVAHF